MPVINPTITFLDFRKAPRLYMEPGKGRLEVKSMTNTVKFQCGDLLTDEDVETLIERGYKVVINTPNNKDYESK